MPSSIKVSLYCGVVDNGFDHIKPHTLFTAKNSRNEAQLYLCYCGENNRVTILSKKGFEIELDREDIRIVLTDIEILGEAVWPVK